MSCHELPGWEGQTLQAAPHTLANNNTPRGDERKTHFSKIITLTHPLMFSSTSESKGTSWGDDH